MQGVSYLLFRHGLGAKKENSDGVEIVSDANSGSG